MVHGGGGECHYVTHLLLFLVTSLLEHFSPFLRNWCWLTLGVSDDSRARSTFVDSERTIPLSRVTALSLARGGLTKRRLTTWATHQLGTLSHPEFPVSMEHTFSSLPPAQHPERLFVDEHLSLPVTPACRRL